MAGLIRDVTFVWVFHRILDKIIRAGFSSWPVFIYSMRLLKNFYISLRSIQTNPLTIFDEFRGIFHAYHTR